MWIRPPGWHWEAEANCWAGHNFWASPVYRADSIQEVTRMAKATLSGACGISRARLVRLTLGWTINILGALMLLSQWLHPTTWIWH
jgi:hypothetical protein